MTRLITVTEALKPWSNFSMITPEVLELACGRGDLFHSLMYRHALGLVIFPEEPEPIQ